MTAPKWDIHDDVTDWKMPPDARAQQLKQGNEDLRDLIVSYYKLETSYPGRFIVEVELEESWETFHLRIIDTLQRPSAEDSFWGEVEPIGDAAEEDRGRIIEDTDYGLGSPNWVVPVAKVLTKATGYNYTALFEVPSGEGDDTGNGAPVE